MSDFENSDYLIPDLTIYSDGEDPVVPTLHEVILEHEREQLIREQIPVRRAHSPTRGPLNSIWCFTCNNPTPEAILAYDTAVSTGKCIYLAYALEGMTAPADGT